MHRFTTIPRVALGAALASAAIAGVPGVASAASSCTYSPTAKVMTVTNSASANQALTLRNRSGTLTFADGTGFNRACLSADGLQFASASNTSKIRVTSAVPAAFQDTVVDEATGGKFVTPAGTRIRISVVTGTGVDHLGLLEGAGNDTVSVRSNISSGPSLDMNGDGTADINMGPAGLVTIDGGAGADTLDGNVSGFYQLELSGGSGKDFLRGGAATDFLDGGPDNDTIVSNLDNKRDFVTGGSGIDTATVDGLDSVAGIEVFDF